MTDTPPKKPPPIPRSPRLEALLKDLDRPLDDTDWSTPAALSRKPGGKSDLRTRMREQRSYRSALKQARAAAARTLGTKPGRQARKRAAKLLTAGAIGVAAFTSPTLSGALGSGPGTTITADLAREPAWRLSASSKLKTALLKSEGKRNTVYRDVAGYPTVGVGHLVLPSDGLAVGQRISDAQVVTLLNEDVGKAEGDVRDLVGDMPLYQHEFDALVDLVFNVGIGNLTPDKSPNLNAAIAARDYDGVAAELQYRYAGGRYIDGLQNRSSKREAMFELGRYERPARIALDDGTNRQS